MTDLQRLCLYALRDMSLTKLNDRYFDGGGIWWTSRVIAGDVEPAQFIQKMYAKRFPKKYQKKLAADKKWEADPFKGW